MDNPCIKCDKQIAEYIEDSEYGCDKPCKVAKEFWCTMGDNLNELLTQANNLLEKLSR